MFRCSMYWQDARTLVIAWADHIKIAKVKERNGKNGASSSGTGASAAAGALQSTSNAVSSLVPVAASSPQLHVEIAAIYQLDCMISGIAPYGKDYLVLAHVTEEDDEDASEDDDRRFKRKEALAPELRIITANGEEHSSDVLSVSNFSRYRCNDYLLVPSCEPPAASAKADIEQRSFYVVTPTELVLAKPRNQKDHLDWLLEKHRYATALNEIEALGPKQASLLGFDSEEIGRTYLNYLVESEQFERAAKAATRILGKNTKAWEDWIFLFVEQGQFDAVIPYIPIEQPTLSSIIYDMVLAHHLRTNPVELLETVRKWPPQIYNTHAVVRAVEDRLKSDPSPIVMESLAAIFIANRQPGKALPYYLRLRKPAVFQMIREHNLFSDVRDQALSLVEFDEDVTDSKSFGASIQLLVDHTFSIPIPSVVAQLEPKPRYLHLYLDALFRKDAQSVSDYSDKQIKLYAEYEPAKLMTYLRTMSSYYNIEQAYEVCKTSDLVPEMVFLLGRVGDNRRALMLIIERLDDVEKAIDFAKEQNDDDLWDDLLKYAETRPTFIRGLLENVEAEIDPLRLIKRIKDGLEIPGLKPALIKILQDFNLQLSLMDGCAAVLFHDRLSYSLELLHGQRHGMHAQANSVCHKCARPLLDTAGVLDGKRFPGKPPAVFFLCRHVFHLSCVVDEARLPKYQRSEAGLDHLLSHARSEHGPRRRQDQLHNEYEAKMRYEARLRVVLKAGCPMCAQRKESARAF